MKLLPQWHVCRVVEPSNYVSYLVHSIGRVAFWGRFLTTCAHLPGSDGDITVGLSKPHASLAGRLSHGNWRNGRHHWYKFKFIFEAVFVSNRMARLNLEGVVRNDAGLR